MTICLNIVATLLFYTYKRQTTPETCFYSLLQNHARGQSSFANKASKFSSRIGQISTQKPSKKGNSSIFSNSTKPKFKPNESAHQLNRKDHKRGENTKSVQKKLVQLLNG